MTFHSETPATVSWRMFSRRVAQASTVPVEERYVLEAHGVRSERESAGSREQLK